MPDETQHRTSVRTSHAATWITPLRVVLLAVLLIIAVFAFQLCSSAATINVTVNGTSYTLHGAKTMQTALKTSGVPVNPGDLISLRGNVLKKDAGNPFSATVNGEHTVDPDRALRNGDEIVVTDGEDIVEDYDAIEHPIAHSATIQGSGPICVCTSEGSDGVTEIRTGRISGEIIEKQTVAPQNLVGTRYTPNVGDEKVIALTFDDGPNETFTKQILDVLAKYDTKATFFCSGTTIERNVEGATALMKRALDEGHCVCAGTYSGTTAFNSQSFNGLGSQSQSDQITRTQQAISAAIGDNASTRIVRVPENPLDSYTLSNIGSHMDAEICWTLSTGDWLGVDSSAIIASLEEVEPGDIILLHDGGTDLTATVEALETMLPKLKSAGYSFITVEQLLEYPRA